MRKKSNFFGFCAILLVALGIAGCDKSTKLDKGFNKIDLVPVLTSEDSRWSMINDKGEIVYDAEFKNRPTAAYNGLFSVEEDGYFVVYKADSKKPVPVDAFEKIKSIGVLEEGLVPASAEDTRIALYDEKGERKYELLPVNGEEIIACSEGFKEGKLWVNTADDKYGFYDTKGKLAIKAEYDYVTDFDCGIALVGKKKEGSGELRYSVIDKDGKNLYDLKGEYDSVDLDGGYVYVSRDSRVYLYDKKGDYVKLPEKVYKVREILGDYIIFTNKEGENGVANVKGEILINPKYYAMLFNTGGSNPTFIVKKDRGDKEMLIINKNGDKEGGDIDYEAVVPAGKFGYIAKDGEHTYLLLDKDLKKKGKEEFYSISASVDNGIVKTDYFSYDAIANSMVAMIGNSGVRTNKFNSQASALLKNETPTYSYSNSPYVPLSDMNKEGYGYNIIVSGVFSQAPARYVSGTYAYEWNPQSLFKGVVMEVHTSRIWGQKGYDAVVLALKNDGFKKDEKLTENSHGEGEVFVKGETAVLIPTATESSYGRIGVFSKEYMADSSDDPEEIDSVEVLVDDDDEYQPAENKAVNASGLPASLPSGGSLSQFSYLWTSRLTPGQISGYSKAQLRILRNAIFAHHGYIFSSDDLKSYFSKFSDYRPTTKNVTNFSAIESDNIALLKKYE